MATLNSLSNNVRFHSQLTPSLNETENARTILLYLRHGHLENGIRKLNLDKANRFDSLVFAFEPEWKHAPTLISRMVSELQRNVEEESLFVRDSSPTLSDLDQAQSDGEHDRPVLPDVANMLLLVVERLKTDYPQEVKNEEVRERHLKVLSAALVEAVHEVHTLREGAYSQALFSPELLNLALHHAKNLELSNLRTQLKAILSKSDASKTALKDLNGEVHRLRLDNYKFNKEKKEIRDRMDEMRHKQHRAECGDEAKNAALVQTRRDYEREKTKNKNIAAAAAKKAADAEDRVAMADKRATRLEDEVWLAERNATHSQKEHLAAVLRTLDAEKTTKEYQEFAQECEEFAQAWQGFYNEVLDIQ